MKCQWYCTVRMFVLAILRRCIRRIPPLSQQLTGIIADHRPIAIAAIAVSEDAKLDAFVGCKRNAANDGS